MPWRVSGLIHDIVSWFGWLLIIVNVGQQPILTRWSWQTMTKHVNRRGIVHPRADSDKPVFTVTASELIEQRHLGLSFKQIGRKLGIDPHKGDVLQVSLKFKLILCSECRGAPPLDFPLYQTWLTRPSKYLYLRETWLSFLLWDFPYLSVSSYMYN